MAVEDVANGEASGNTDLLGHASCPPWLKPDRFLETEFNADACVADLRRFVPLATLQNELSNYLATLKTKLVEVINEDYSEYVGLSGRLANVEGSVVRMRKPLLELRDKLHAVQEAVRSELMSLNQGLRRRKEVATQRGLLELILEVQHVAGKVEKLLEEVAAVDDIAAAANGAADGAPSAPPSSAPAPAPAPAELLSRCRLLERVAAEVSRLAFLANKGKDLAFVRSLEPRIAAHRSALGGRLRAALAAALAPPARNPAAALHCLHAAADLGETAAAEGVVRRVLVAPLVEEAIQAYKAQGHTASSASSAAGGGLASLLASVLESFRAAAGPLLAASLGGHMALTTEGPGGAGEGGGGGGTMGALRGLDLLGGCLVEEVQGALAAAMPGVFSPGVPPAFHAHYRATLAWLGAVEGLCGSRAAVERLRSSPAVAALLRRWNLGVYFSLLYQEIAGELEDGLSSERLEPAPAPSASASSSPALLLAPSAALLRCLARASSPDAVLPPLVDRFLRLALQCSQRYAAWLGGIAEARREAAAGAAQGQAAGPQGQVQGGAGGAGTGSGGGWVGALGTEELAAAVHDAEAISAFISGPFTATFLGLLPASPSPAPASPAPLASPSPSPADLLTTALAEAAAAVRAAGRSLAACLGEEAAERCVGVARQLKGITATYRLTAKGPPSRASHYVAGVLAPLRQLLEAGPVQRMGPAAAKELFTLPVAESLAARYGALAEELLAGVRKTESSLKRFKKAKGKEGEEEPTGAAALSDSDKIAAQLHLDAAELGRLLGCPPFGVAHPAAELPSWRRLVEAVEPPPGVLAAAGLAGHGAGGLL